MFFYPNRILIYSARGRFAEGGEEVDNDNQKLPLVTFLKLLTERKKVPMSCQLNLCSWQQCSDLCSSPFPALSTSLLYFEADERGLDFRRKEGVHHFHRRLIIFFFDSGIPDSVV